MRKINWQSDLNSLINEKKDTPFEWGKWDCGKFVAEVANAILEDSKDYYKPFKGRYSTALGATRALRKAGFTDLREYLVHCCGEPIGPSHAWRGDVAFYEECAGVNLGSFNYLLGVKPIGVGVEQSTGFIQIPRLEVQEYFRVR